MLSPLAIDPAHPFPFIPNAGFVAGAAARTRAPTAAGCTRCCRCRRRSTASSACRPRGAKLRFLPLEELLLLHLDSLFPGYRMTGHCTFRVLRDSDLEVEEEAEDLVREFETALKRRRRGEVVRLKISADAPERAARA